MGTLAAHAVSCPAERSPGRRSPVRPAFPCVVAYALLAVQLLRWCAANGDAPTCIATTCMGPHVRRSYGERWDREKPHPPDLLKAIPAWHTHRHRRTISRDA